MKFIYILAILFSAISLYSATISGLVTDSETKEPLRGVTVRILSSTKGAITNADGFYELNDVNLGKVKLQFSYLGYAKKEVEIELNSNLKLNMILEAESLRTSELVVSANKRLQAVQEVPITIAIIDKEFIQNQAYTSISDFMEFIPGVEVNQDNISIRGSSGFSFGVGSRTAMLLDGFPLLAGDNGDVKTDAIPFFNIERVEVVKGAGSALYGSSAMGGVINVITSEPSEIPDFRLRAYSGFYTEPRYEEWQWTDNLQLRNGVEASFGQKFGKTGLIISGAYLYDDNYRDYNTNDRYNFYAKLSHELSDKSKIKLSTNYSMTNTDDWVYWKSLSHPLIPPDGVNRDARVESGKFAIFGNYEYIFNENTFLNVKLGNYTTFYQNTIDPDSPEFRQSDAFSNIGEVQLNSQLLSNVLGTFGLFVQNANVDSRTYGDHTQNIYAAYTQFEYKPISNLIFTAGTRLDYEKASNLEGESSLSPKLGISYIANDNLSFRASTGAGFRAPAIAERYSTLEFQGFTVIDNPDLKAERSWSYEIGGTYEFRSAPIPFSVDLSAFQNDLFDLIEPQFDVSQDASIIFENLLRARIRGVEATFRASLFGWVNLQTSITYMDPQDLDLNETMKYRSNWLWYTTAIVPYKFIDFQVDYRYKSRVENIDERLAIQITDHDARTDIHVVNTSIKFKISEISNLPLDLTLNSRNLLDYYYTEVPGNMGPTRFIGLIIDYKL